MFAKIRFSWHKKFIKLRNGVPSHDTISRVFRMIRPDAFQEAFLAWVSGLNFGSDGLNVVAIDGVATERDAAAQMLSVGEARHCRRALGCISRPV